MQQQMKLFHFSWTGVTLIQWLAKCWTCPDIETIDDHKAGWDLVRLVPSWMACLLSVGRSEIIHWFCRIAWWNHWSWVLIGCHVRFMLLCLFSEVTVVLFFGEIIPSAVFTGSAKPVSQRLGIQLFVGPKRGHDSCHWQQRCLRYLAGNRLCFYNVLFYHSNPVRVMSVSQTIQANRLLSILLYSYT